MMIDASKHREIFDISRHGPSQGSAIVGLGCIGSRLAIHYGELGLGPNLLVDDDKIELHNIANQAYNVTDIGFHKVNVMRQMLLKKANINAVAFPMRILEKIRMPYSIVASCVDSMASRKMLLECVRGSQENVLFVDGRMTATTVLVYAFDPRESKQLKAYEQTLYSDEEVDERQGGCSLTQSVGITAQFAASLMTARTIDWLTGRKQVFETAFDWQKGFYKEALIEEVLKA